MSPVARRGEQSPVVYSASTPTAGPNSHSSQFTRSNGVTRTTERHDDTSDGEHNGGPKQAHARHRSVFAPAPQRSLSSAACAFAASGESGARRTVAS